VRSAARLVVPGVGSHDAAIRNLNALELKPALLDRLESGVPILAICLGLQILTRSSAEGRLPGVGWLAGETVRLARSGTDQGPHIGWNQVKWTRPDRLTRGIPDASRFYFCHTFAVLLDNPSEGLGTTTHRGDFPSVVASRAVRGTQFHPEKSGADGERLLRNFLEMGC